MKFLISVFLIIICTNYSFCKDNKIELSKYIHNANDILIYSNDIIHNMKEDKIHVNDVNFFTDKHSNQEKQDKNLAKSRILKDSKLSKQDGSFFYLQSISYGGVKNWSIVLNNISINSSMPSFNISDIMEVYSVMQDSVKLKILNPNQDILNKNQNDKRIQSKIINGVVNCYITLKTNEYFDVNTYEISSGNMINNLYSVS